MSVKIALANQKGGVGKTTSTIELAACFKDMGYNVLIVDLEQQCDTTKVCGGNPFEPGIYEVLKGRVKILDAIQKTDEVDLLAASEALSNADVDFNDPLDVLLLKKVLQAVEDIYDFVIIDSNPGRNKLLNMLYIACDYILIPTDADDNSVAGIKRVFSDLNEYKEANWTNAEILGIIYGRYENTGMHKYTEEYIKEILAEYNSNAFIMKVRKCIAATECKTERTSMQRGKRYSNAAVDYRAIAKTILNDYILKEAEE